MGEVSEVAAKLKQLREGARIPVRDFAARLGMPAGSYKHYEDRYKKPYLPRDFVLGVARELAKEGVDPAQVMALAGDERGEIPLETSEPSATALIPVYDVRASAGPGLVPAEYAPVTHQVAFAMDYIRSVLRLDPKRLGLISVSGDSMEPTLAHGDLVLLDMADSSFDVEGIFVFRHDDAIHIKRVIRSARPGHILAIPDNDFYPRQEYATGDVAIIGRVVWSGGMIRSRFSR